ncbi:MAG: hypothetical protein HGA96_04225 [Desulfobulbaceae bacterium]|nr:hypothetical protein [Desulfobulbaceae bacterium]
MEDPRKYFNDYDYAYEKAWKYCCDHLGACCCDIIQLDKVHSCRINSAINNMMEIFKPVSPDDYFREAKDVVLSVLARKFVDYKEL